MHHLSLKIQSVKRLPYLKREQDVDPKPALFEVPIHAIEKKKYNKILEILKNVFK